MPKLDIKFSEAVQGTFSVKALNLLLTFQVNCPGCFLYAMPLVQKLWENSAENELNVFVLSTAFEDFELNTLENTQALIREKKIIGETKKALAQYGFEKYPDRLDFSVLMDAFVSPEDFLSEARLDEIVNANPKLANSNEIKDEIRRYFSRYEKIPYTFTVNNFAGTPTWVIFDESFEVLAHWFGHKRAEEIEWIIKSVRKI